MRAAAGRGCSATAAPATSNRFPTTRHPQGTIDGEERTLGRVAYRKTTAAGDRIELGFRPSGGSLILPSVRGINYSDMVLWETYQTSEFTFTRPAGSRARADTDAAYAGRLAGGLAPGEEICTTCDAGVADLEAMGDPDPAPKDPPS